MKLPRWSGAGSYPVVVSANGTGIAASKYKIMPVILITSTPVSFRGGQIQFLILASLPRSSQIRSGHIPLPDPVWKPGFTSSIQSHT